MSIWDVGEEVVESMLRCYGSTYNLCCKFLNSNEAAAKSGHEIVCFAFSVEIWTKQIVQLVKLLANLNL